jgi:hypothetical protein
MCKSCVPVSLAHARACVCVLQWAIEGGPAAQTAGQAWTTEPQRGIGDHSHDVSLPQNREQGTEIQLQMELLLLPQRTRTGVERVL